MAEAVFTVGGIRKGAFDTVLVVVRMETKESRAVKIMTDSESLSFAKTEMEFLREDAGEQMFTQLLFVRESNDFFVSGLQILY